MFVVLFATTLGALCGNSSSATLRKPRAEADLPRFTGWRVYQCVDSSTCLGYSYSSVPAEVSPVSPATRLLDEDDPSDEGSLPGRRGLSSSPAPANNMCAPYRVFSSIACSQCEGGYVRANSQNSGDCAKCAGGSVVNVVLALLGLTILFGLVASCWVRWSPAAETFDPDAVNQCRDGTCWGFRRESFCGFRRIMYSNWFLLNRSQVEVDIMAKYNVCFTADVNGLLHMIMQAVLARGVVLL